MNQEQAFLQAIRERPGAYDERLIYGDWLMDQGNPRGEFIHCQVRAARQPRASPQRLDLEAQAHDLLLVHESDWLGPLVGTVANWEWRGGFLDWVTVAAEVFLAHAERWLPALPLLGVHLRKARLHVAALARCEQLAHLSGLYLGDNDLTDDDLEVLFGSPYLKGIRSLYLHSNDLGVKGIRHLARTPNLPRLRELNLGNNRLGDEAIAILASSHLRRLRALHLPMVSLHEAGVRTLAGSPLLSRLRVLGVGMNQLPPGCLATLARAPAFAGVHVFGYEMNRPNAEDVAALASSPHAAGLRHLSLDAYRTLDNTGLRALAAGPCLGQLRSLSLGVGSWGPTGVRALGQSRTLTSLRTLRILVDDENGRLPKALLGQPLIRRLRHLDLEGSRVGAAGLAALAAHPRPVRFRELNAPLSSDMAAEWEKLLSKRFLAQLTSLTLTDPPAGSVRALLGPDRLPELRQLTLHGLPDLDEFQELLDSPLLGRLHALRINLAFQKEEQQESEVIRRLSAAWHVRSLRRLGLLWSLSPKVVRLLAAAAPPPALTELEIGVFRLGVEGMAALAGSPLLRQLRRLVLCNSSSQAVPGLEALAQSPHAGPLLRVDIQNGHVPSEAVAAVRHRFGGRFAVSGRMLPRTISLGGWHQLHGDGEE